METKTYQNPVLSGFYPDPSICRVGEDYYLVTSSFCYFPGIPIFQSRDLVNWKQIGHGISRAEQMDYENCAHSGGIWAPTIRYHKGTYYIIYTFVNIESDERPESICKNYIITADDPAGPWSPAVLIEDAQGIDPSIIFDEEDRLWYISNRRPTHPVGRGHRELYVMPLDPESCQRCGEKTVVWDGASTNSDHIEAPHLYQINEWYYLIAAEGGTEWNHSIVMARSRTITGPYEICPRNPIITHRHLIRPGAEIAATGHGDIVRTQNGEWWMVLLGVRPYGAFQYNLGRETFLVPVKWETDGWLTLNSDTGLVKSSFPVPDLPAQPWLQAQETAEDDFGADELNFIWNTMRPLEPRYYDLKTRKGCLRLYAKAQSAAENGTPAFIARRQQHQNFSVHTAIEPDLKQNGDQAGLLLIQNHRYQYQYVIEKAGENCHICLYEVRDGSCCQLSSEQLQPTQRYYLRVLGTTEGYSFYWSEDEDSCNQSFNNADPTLLSTSAAGGFTGTYIGMYAFSKKENGTRADFDWFRYKALNY